MNTVQVRHNPRQIRTTADRIRRAALGPTPTFAGHLIFWLPSSRVFNNIAREHDLTDWHRTSDSARRMFLLFVAESLEDQ